MSATDAATLPGDEPSFERHDAGGRERPFLAERGRPPPYNARPAQIDPFQSSTPFVRTS
ncbi:hypothetical protein BC2230_210006 [Burkholderia cepacia]